MVCLLRRLYLERSRSRPAAIITPSSGPGTILDASEFGYTYEACPDISFMCQLPSGYLVDGRYFSDHSAGSSVDLGTLTTLRMAGIGITILGGGPVSAFESTKLDNIEFNFHVPVREGCTVFSGIRYLQLTDRLAVDLANSSLYTTWNEENHMCGAGRHRLRFLQPRQPAAIQRHHQGGRLRQHRQQSFYFSNCLRRLRFGHRHRLCRRGRFHGLVPGGRARFIPSRLHGPVDRRRLVGPQCCCDYTPGCRRNRQSREHGLRPLVQRRDG